MDYTKPEDIMKVKDFPAYMRGLVKELVEGQVIDAGKVGGKTLTEVQESAVSATKDSAGNVIADTYAKKSDIATAYRFKGSLDTYALLPTNAEVGDVYNIGAADASHNVKAGDNLAWAGKDWDNLSGIVDLSAYATTADVNTTLGSTVTRVAALETSVGNISTALDRING